MSEQNETESGATVVAEEPKKLAPLDDETMRSTRLYELCLLFDPSEATRTWDKLAEWIKSTLTDRYGAHVYQVDKWADSRKLAYEIKGLKRGTYMVVWFRAKPAITSELDREIRLDERSARHLLLVHDFEPPTVGMAAEDFEALVKDREPRDRDFGGGGYRDRGDRDRRY
jgi:ribosomal protein S6